MDASTFTVFSASSIGLIRLKASVLSVRLKSEKLLTKMSREKNYSWKLSLDTKVCKFSTVLNVDKELDQQTL